MKIEAHQIIYTSVKRNKNNYYMYYCNTRTIISYQTLKAFHLFDADSSESLLVHLQIQPTNFKISPFHTTLFGCS